MQNVYKKFLNIPKDWDKDSDFNKRDRFVLSKGHASPLLYATLAEVGLIDKTSLMTFRKLHSKLQGHPSKGTVPGIETSTGSLGQGLSVACGIAMGLKLDKNPARVIAYLGDGERLHGLLGDGELQEGSNWEAFMQASHRNLDNLIAIIDRNRLQIDGNTENVMALDSLSDKIKAFGWNITEIDGHNFKEIYDTFLLAKNSNKPFAIIANTTKGKGVSFMENNAGWHGKAPSVEDYEKAMRELL